MLNGLTTVRTAILRILQSKIEKGDQRHKQWTQRGPKFPKRSPRGPGSPKGDPLCNSVFVLGPIKLSIWQSLLVYNALSL